eukprot:14989707-Alexandrium_andersonii.AAC.1
MGVGASLCQRPGVAARVRANALGVWWCDVVPTPRGVSAKSRQRLWASAWSLGWGLAVVARPPCQCAW